MRYASLVLVCGCGRLSFEPLADAPERAADAPADAPTPPCLVEDFSTDTGMWQPVLGSYSLQPGAGPDGSPAYVGAIQPENLATNAALRGIRTARVRLDFRIDTANGDFNVFWFKPFTSYATATGYEALLVPANSDTLNDALGVWTNGSVQTFAQRPGTIVMSTWHHIDAELRADGSMQLDLDGAPWLSSPPDATVSPPFDVILRLFYQGAIDNISVDCTR
ncbi:MAG TPA: hypothetical protein VMZ53_16220 [Kofleriaceae bacterium]|nr:hypothetical protein [Kofleriaceae bacterium]